MGGHEELLQVVVVEQQVLEAGQGTREMDAAEGAVA